MTENYTIKELSEFLKCSISELRKLVRSNTIPYYRIGKKLFFKKASIDSWIAELEQSASNKISEREVY